MRQPEVNDAPRCPRCGRILSQDSSQGLCPTCLGKLAFGPELSESALLPRSLSAIRFFGDYELLGEVARGGMGVVYRARQIHLEREVAVKLMLHGLLASEEEVRRFRSEAAAAASLKHPGIVAIHEVGEVEGQHYFSMDLVAGRDLAVATRQGPLPARQGAELTAQIARAVQHAHEHGILHRDLKPSNVIVDADWRAHVTDFGLARRLESETLLTESGQALGTPGYMAPEQATGKPSEISTAADVYAIGAVLYHLLTGRAPFTGENAADVLRQVVEREPVAPSRLNPAVPVDLETICLKCLNHDIARRYASASEVADDLDRFLRHEPIHARPISNFERLVRWRRRNPALAGSLGAVAGLVLLLLAGSLIAAHRINEARKAELAQRLEAQARLHQGEALVNFMLGDLSDRLEPVGRLDVLESAIAEVDKYYAALPAEQMIPESRGHRAKALFQIGAVRTSQGRFAEAIPNYFAALNAYTNLLAAYPTNLQWQYDWARTLNDLGFAYIRMENSSNALATWDACLHARERLVQLQPTNGTWLGGYASTALNLGQSNRRLGHLAEAGEYLRIAEKACRQWVALDPGATLPKDRLAVARGAMGQWFEAQGKLDEAALVCGEKIQILRELLKMDPENTRHKADLANGLDLLGITQEKQTNFDAAVSTLSEGVALNESLVARDAANHEWQLNLISLLVERGQVWLGMKRPAEALKDFQRVWEISKPQAATVKQYPSWLRNWRQSLDGGEQAERDLAASAEAGGNTVSAQAHRHRANEMHAEAQALGN